MASKGSGNATLDPVVFDTYKKYKAGTKKLVSYLADTARKTKLVDDLFSRTKSLKLYGRHTRKERSQNEHAYQISPGALIRLAKAIATSDTDKIPNALIRTLQEVISARKECAGWFVL